MKPKQLYVFIICYSAKIVKRFTQKEINQTRYMRLSKNPNPNDTDISYLKWDVYTMPPECYENKVLSDWKFDKADMPIVRHRIKNTKSLAIDTLKIGTLRNENGTKK